MKGKTAIVTGGSRGIGRATTLKLASEGANMIINYAGNQTAAEETAEKCRNMGVEAFIVKGNVADSDDCNRIVSEALERFGKIDILVNNAGITRDNILMRMSDEDFDQVMDTNLRGTYLMMKAVSRPMIKARSGRIINLASVVGIMGNTGQVNYAASKAGVIGMTKSFAKEVATRGITVNAVAPGFIDTDMTAVLSDDARKEICRAVPMNKMGCPEDVANAIAFLASDESSYITGQVLSVDGGMCM